MSVTDWVSGYIIIIIIKPRLTRHMSVTKEDESQARGHEIVYG